MFNCNWILALAAGFNLFLVLVEIKIPFVIRGFAFSLIYLLLDMGFKGACLSKVFMKTLVSSDTSSFTELISG